MNKVKTDDFLKLSQTSVEEILSKEQKLKNSAPLLSMVNPSGEQAEGLLDQSDELHRDDISHAKKRKRNDESNNKIDQNEAEIMAQAVSVKPTVDGIMSLLLAAKETPKNFASLVAQLSDSDKILLRDRIEENHQQNGDDLSVSTAAVDDGDGHDSNMGSPSSPSFGLIDGIQKYVKINEDDLILNTSSAIFVYVLLF